MSGAAKRTDHGGRRDARSGTAAVEERAVRRGVVRAVAVRYPLGSFVVLAFVVSWTAWGPLLADRQGWVTWPASTYLHLLGALGPLVAAVVVTALGRGWGGLGVLWRQATAWRGRGRWLALATLGPLALFLVAVVVARLVEGQWPALDRFGASTEYPALPIVAYWLANLVFYGFGEEVGWRGYLQPTLEQRRPVLGAAAILSVIWALWHLPLFGITAGYRQLPAVGFIGFYFSLLVAALVFAWLWHRSGYSLLVVAVFHGVFDIAATTPTDTTLIPILMGAAVSLAGLAAIPALRTMEPSRPTGGVQARSSTGCQGGPGLSVRNRVVNPLVRALLRSPAHRVMSGGVLLLTYTGRRSGRRYTLPVQYARADHGLILWPAHHDRKRWWRNLQPPAPVQLRLAGRELHGTAQVLVDDPAQVADALTIFLARFPSARRVLGVAADASPDAIKQAAEHQIIVCIATDDRPADPHDTERV